MTRLSLLSSAMLVAIMSTGVSAADSPQVVALQNQVKLVKAQETAVRKEVKAWYERMIKGEKLTEAAAAKERDALTKQEKQLLENATSEDDKKEIKKQYDALRAALSGEVKIDAEMIKKLRDLERTHDRQLDLAFNAKIAQLENQIKVLRQIAAKMKK
jgi:hypothetical protein